MSTITLTQLIALSQAPGVERILAHDDHYGCTVNIHNGVVDKCPVDFSTWAAFQKHVKAAGWKFTPSLSHRGYMASPVMTKAETLEAQARWNDRHPAEDYGLEPRG
jgi:hypothetical protein